MFRRIGPRIGRLVSVLAGVVLIAEVGAAARPAPGQEPDPLPTGREVVDRFIDAIGGRDAIAAISSYRTRGTFELTDQGLIGELEMIAARPARNVVKVNLPGVGEVLSGYDGKVAWTVNPASGPAVLSGAAAAQAAEDAAFDAVLHPPSLTQELTVVERVEFNDRSCYKVKVVFGSGRELFEYYDIETGLKIGTEGSHETPLGLVPSTTVLSDYRSFGGLRQATVIVQRPLGIEQVVRLVSFEYNAVADEAFELPAAIKALIK